ncbi:MAG: type II toxin-antitoxin system PemK/MazF family toxin [Candidatus Peribacteria bacterium]|nr:MAG: type II toxin-antitoxin system PemK/MazF family toxin [Candidatus Peribacteria bacterium]
MKSIDNFTFGDIILADYVFSDNSDSKLRPVLVLFRDGDDYTVMKITSKYQQNDDFTISLEPDTINNIKMLSYIKIKKITTFHKSLFLEKKI